MPGAYRRQQLARAGRRRQQARGPGCSPTSHPRLARPAMDCAPTLQARGAPDADAWRAKPHEVARRGARGARAGVRPSSRAGGSGLRSGCEREEGAGGRGRGGGDGGRGGGGGGSARLVVTGGGGPCWPVPARAGPHLPWARHVRRRALGPASLGLARAPACV